MATLGETANTATYPTDAGTHVQVGIYCAANQTQTTNATGGLFDRVTGFDTNGPAVNGTPDHTNNKLTITRTGLYLVGFCVHFDGSASSPHYLITVWKNSDATTNLSAGAGSRLTEISSERDTSSVATGSTSSMFPVSLTASDELTLAVTDDVGGVAFNMRIGSCLWAVSLSV